MKCVLSMILGFVALLSANAQAGGGGDDCGGSYTVQERLYFMASDTQSPGNKGFKLTCAYPSTGEENFTENGKQMVRSKYDCVASSGVTLTINSLEITDDWDCRTDVRTLLTTDQQTCDINSVAVVMEQLFKSNSARAECVTRGTRTACFHHEWNHRFGVFYVFDLLGQDQGCVVRATQIPGTPKDIEKIFK